MNKFDRMNLTIDEVDFDDQSYIFTFEPSLSAISQSIQRIGLLHPPLLEQKALGRYRIVCGLKRLLALRQLKFTDFPARICYSQDDAPTVDRLVLALYDNLGTRPLNLIEKAQFIYKMIRAFGVPHQEILATYLPLLELGANPQVLERLLALNELEDYVKRAVVKATVTVDMALSLLRRQPAERRALFDLFQTLRLGSNRQRELFKLLIDLSALTEQPIPDLLQMPAIAAILENSELDHVLKTQRLKQQLLRLRFPRLAQAEANFYQLKRSLKLPPNLILQPPPFFEGDRFKLEMQFKDAREFKKLLATLTAIAETKQLEQLTILV